MLMEALLVATPKYRRGTAEKVLTPLVSKLTERRSARMASGWELPRRFFGPIFL
jgi:hypothetical protein